MSPDRGTEAGAGRPAARGDRPENPFSHLLSDGRAGPRRSPGTAAGRAGEDPSARMGADQGAGNQSPDVSAAPAGAGPLGRRTGNGGGHGRPAGFVDESPERPRRFAGKGRDRRWRRTAGCAGGVSGSSVAGCGALVRRARTKPAGPRRAVRFSAMPVAESALASSIRLPGYRSTCPFRSPGR